MEKINIVILDGYVANDGDLSWGALEKLGNLKVYDRTAADEVVVRSKDADAIIVNKVAVTDEIMEHLPRLRYIGELATGYNNIDIQAARRRGIDVCNVPAYSTESVAQNIFAHLLNITNRVAMLSATVKEGAWTHCPDFSYRPMPIEELYGMTMGIYGLGHIGSRVAEIARAFGMKIIALTSKPQADLPDYIEKVDKEELFLRSDVLSLNAPLTPDNKNFVNAETLALMKPDAILLNASRGGLVDEQALADALNEGRIKAAGVDVLSTEPPMPGNPLVMCQRCEITPHVAWQSTAARRALLSVTADNLSAWLAGKPSNLVN